MSAEKKEGIMPAEPALGRFALAPDEEIVADSGAKYRILEERGRGGNGIVYKAASLNANTTVAVKLFSPSYSIPQDEVLRLSDGFVKESRRLELIKHPYIVAIEDFGYAAAADGKSRVPFFVMEFIPENVRNWLLEGRIGWGKFSPYEFSPFTSPERGKRASWLALLSYVEQLVAALSEIHSAGWVHRDIKPENVLIAGSGAKLSDPGIASAIPAFEERVQALIAESLHVAPVAYLSPEQQQRKIDSQRAMRKVGTQRPRGTISVKASSGWHGRGSTCWWSRRSAQPNR